MFERHKKEKENPSWKRSLIIICYVVCWVEGGRRKNGSLGNTLGPRYRNRAKCFG